VTKLKQLKGKVIQSIGFVLAFILSSGSVHAAVNYLKIQASGNGSSTAVTFSIGTAVPPVNSTVHYYGVSELIIPYYPGSYYYLDTQTMYVAGVPSKISATNTQTGAVTQVSSTGGTVSFSGIGANPPMLLFPDGFVVGSGYSYTDGTYKILAGNGMRLTNLRSTTPCSIDSGYPAVSYGVSMGQNGAYLVASFIAYGLVGTPCSTATYYAPFTFANVPVSAVIGY